MSISVLYLCPNSVLRDVRIMKQILSLVAAGHKVRAIGILESDDQSPRTEFEEQLTVERVGWRAAAYRRAAQLLALRLVGLGLFTLVIAIAAAWGGFASLTVLWRAVIDALNLIAPGLRFELDLYLFPLSVSELVAALMLLTTVVGLVAAKFTGLLNKFLAPIKRLLQLSANYASVRDGRFGLRAVVEKALGSDRPVRFLVRELVEHFRTRCTFDGVQFARCQAIRRQAESEPFDVVIAAEASSLAAAASLASKHAKPMIYDAHEFYDDVNLASSHVAEYYRKVHRQHISKAKFVSVVSDAMAEVYDQTYGTQGRTIVLPNCVNKLRYPHEKSQRVGSIHELARLPVAKKILLYHGGLAKGRGIERLVDAAQFLADDRSLVVLGDGKLREHIQSAVKHQALTWADECHAQNLSRLLQEHSAARRAAKTELLAEIANFADPDEWRSISNEVVNKALGIGSFSKISVNPLGSRGRSAVVDGEHLEALSREIGEYVDALFRCKLSTLADRPDIDAYDKIRCVYAVPQTELLATIEDAWVGIVPYPNSSVNHWICAPNKFWECAASGVPLVVTPLKQLTDFVQGDDLGWVMPPDLEGKALAGFLNSLTERDRDQKALNIKSFAQENTWEDHVAEWVREVETVSAPR
ncbi:glycosyltransferase [Maricaulis sp. MIT060901]|uniref:glycosyltransferase n=1 Tax=Maricaulis sp. MIT060901 TaxID=3096993 RepID=UPI00399A96BA